MIVSAAIDHLWVVCADACADRHPLAEVEGRAGHGGKLPGRDQGRIDRRVAIGVDREDVIADPAHTVAGEIEVGVTREINHGWFIRCRLVIDAQLVVVGESIDDLDRKRAGIAFLAIFARIAEPCRGAALAGQRLDRPDDLVEAFHAAMQAVRPVIGGELVLRAVERELRGADAIAIAPDQGAEIGILGTRSRRVP